MKYMMSIRQSLTHLKKADEIKVNYIDKGRLYDLLAENEKEKINAEIYIYISKDDVIDWDEIKTFSNIFSLHFGLEDAFFISTVKEHGYDKVFWSYPVTSFWELRGLIDLGVNEVLLDAPLYFDLNKVKKICDKSNVEIRLIANQCFNSYMPRENGIKGPYIRPEDVEYYEQYVSHIEFISDRLEKELTLIDVYKNKKAWPGNLNLLLNNLKENIDNRGFNGEPFAERRANCGQRCQSDGICHYCNIIFDLINTIDYHKKYLNETYGSVSEEE